MRETTGQREGGRVETDTDRHRDRQTPSSAFEHLILTEGFRNINHASSRSLAQQTGSTDVPRFPPFLSWAKRRAPKTERLITFHAPASLGDVAGEEPATEWRQREQTSTSAGAEQISFSLTEGQVWLEGGGEVGGGGGGDGSSPPPQSPPPPPPTPHPPTLSLSPSTTPPLFSPLSDKEQVYSTFRNFNFVPSIKTVRHPFNCIPHGSAVNLGKKLPFTTD